MAYDLVTVSAILCEIMRKELDKPLDKPADFTGPYASGDTPITVNIAAKLGAKTAVIGSVPPAARLSAIIRTAAAISCTTAATPQPG